MGEIVNYLSISWEAKVTSCRGSFEKKKKSPELRSHGSMNDEKDSKKKKKLLQYDSHHLKKQNQVQFCLQMVYIKDFSISDVL